MLAVASRDVRGARDQLRMCGAEQGERVPTGQRVRAAGGGMDSGDGRVLIAGGGIGGVAAAVALRRAGVAAEVFERAGSLGGIQVGGCYVLWYGGVRSLAVLGLAEQAHDVGHRVDRFELCDARGRVLQGVEVGRRGRELGAVPLAVRRADLHRVLTGALDPEAFHLGAALARVGQSADGVVAFLADGREERGAVLVGADGMGSAVRQQLHGSAEPVHPGYAHWSGMAQDVDAFPAGTFRVLHGDGARFAFFHLGDGQVCWWCVRNAPQGPAGDASGTPEALREQFGGWAPPVAALLDATPPETVHRRDTLDRPPARRWGAGRVTLLGDAAHAMTFNLGQGAGTALSDAVTLPRHLTARQVAPGADPAPALRAYEAERRPITTAITRMSRQVGWMASWEGRLAHVNHEVMRRGRRVMPRFFELDLRSHRTIAPALLPTPGTTTRETTMTPEENKAIIRRYFEGAWGRGEDALIDEHVAEDAVLHDLVRQGLPPGRAGVRASLQAFRDGFPDMTVEMHDLIAEGDLVAFRFHSEGTHTGEMRGVLPTGRRASLDGLVLTRLRDGQIVEGWAELGLMDMLQELRVLPAGGMPKPMQRIMMLVQRLRDRLGPRR